jgi:hypothetical protein
VTPSVNVHLARMRCVRTINNGMRLSCVAAEHARMPQNAVKEGRVFINSEDGARRQIKCSSDDRRENGE